MTAKEAYSILTSKFPGVKVGKCYEYKTVYVFQLTPSMLRLSKTPAQMIDCLLSVNKSTKEVRDFKPFYISIDEYESGREVPATKYRG